MTLSPIKRIACIGEVMIELIAGKGSSGTIGVAGDTYNTAVYLKKLLQDETFSVSYVTALGADSFSKRILDEAHRHHLDCSYIETFEDKMPGLYAINTDEHGERSFSYWRSEAAARSMFSENSSLKLEALHDFDLIYLSGITMAILPQDTRNRLIDFLKTFRAEGGNVAYDSNYRPKLWESEETARTINSSMWSVSNIALPSVDDEMMLFGNTTKQEVLSRIDQNEIFIGALKCGGEGPSPIGASSTIKEFPPVEKIVDTTAAGDSFNSGFLAALAEGKNLDEALLGGHKLASKVIQAKGAIIDL